MYEFLRAVGLCFLMLVLCFLMGAILVGDKVSPTPVGVGLCTLVGGGFFAAVFFLAVDRLTAPRGR